MREGGGADTALPTIETQSDVAHIQSVQDYIGQYQEDGLFECCPPRCHRGFEEFTRITKVSQDAWKESKDTEPQDGYTAQYS